MIAVSLEEICKWTSGSIIRHGYDHSLNHVTIDSRNASPGSLFVPIKGEHKNGHTFMKDAALNGGSATLIEAGFELPEDLPDHFSVIRVENCLTAMQAMASKYRKLFSLPVLAITGSNGKTTTKDMLAGVLGKKMNVVKSKGNYNNHLGLPLSLFELDQSHEGVVLEMGMSGLGEISLLTRIAQPDVAYITNVGRAHIEKLGSKEKIADAKMEIAEGLKQGGILVVNGDDPLLRQKALKHTGDHRLVTVGASFENEFVAVDLVDQPGVGFAFKTNITGAHQFVVHHPGIHHLISALFAIWTGLHYDIGLQDIQKGLLAFQPSGMRMERVFVDSRTFINDAYNANPESMKAAISMLHHMASKRKIAILGDMLELGEYSEKCHRDLSNLLIVGNDIDLVILMGELTKHTLDELEKKGFDPRLIHHVQSPVEACEVLRQHSRPDDLILIKGSRSMGMERIIHRFVEGEC